MVHMKRILLILAVLPLIPLWAQPSAWNKGYPQNGLKNADALVAGFKAKAQHLGDSGKLRILIIGDSLSDGSYHWSHHFRKNLQAAYGNGGPGAVWSTFAGDSPQHGAMPGWLIKSDGLPYGGDRMSATSTVALSRNTACRKVSAPFRCIASAAGACLFSRRTRA
jgi:hypothetical protein